MPGRRALAEDPSTAMEVLVEVLPALGLNPWLRLKSLGSCTRQCQHAEMHCYSSTLPRLRAET